MVSALRNSEAQRKTKLSSFKIIMRFVTDNCGTKGEISTLYELEVNPAER